MFCSVVDLLAKDVLGRGDYTISEKDINSELENLLYFYFRYVNVCGGVYNNARKVFL